MRSKKTERFWNWAERTKLGEGRRRGERERKKQEREPEFIDPVQMVARNYENYKVWGVN